MHGLSGKLSRFSSTWTLALICIVAFATMYYLARTEAPIMDELAHIPAGYGYVRHLDYRLNPEHPPLVKAIAAFPLLFLNPAFPTENPNWATALNGQWDMGRAFLYGTGNDADQIVRTARLGPILLTILLIILIYIWARELMGNFWGLLPAALFAFSPTVLAHGHYVTTDIGAALGVVLGTYYFVKFLHEPSRKRLLCAGLAFGAAQLMKFSAPLLVPLFVFLIVIFYGAGVMRDWNATDATARFKRFGIRAWRYLKSLIIVFAVGYAVVVYPVYFLFTVNYPIEKQAADTETLFSSFANGPTPPGEMCAGVRCLADLNIWMSKNYVTRPLAEYMLGVLMVMQRSAGGNTSYFLGEVSRVGSRLYFPFVYLAKESLPVLFMVFFALAYTIWGILKKVKNERLKIKNNILDYLGTNFAEFSMISFIVLYWGYSMKSPLNIGVRHLIPTLPFIYILTAGAWKRWIMKIHMPDMDSLVGALKAGFRAITAMTAKYVLLIVLLFWFVFETAFAFPYFLSYFNEFAGGTSGGYRYVTDSNYDWGQDFLYLKKFVDAHPEIDKLAIDFFGAASPSYYFGDCTNEPQRRILAVGKTAEARGACAEGWWSARGNPSQTQTNADNAQTDADNVQTNPESQRKSALSQRESAIYWFAISINTLQGAIQPLHPSQDRKPEDEYRWLVQLRPPKPGLGNVPEPDYRIGTSIFVYKL